MTSKLSTWTILPPLRLRNVGTPIVESVEHYAIRLAWVAGVSIGSFAKLAKPFDEPGMQRVFSTTGFCGPGKFYRRRIENLEALTGDSTLRCGSFWKLADILARGSCRPPGERQWCPLCYREWDDEKSSEPLLWTLALSKTCAVHGCDLEDRCQKCGSKQGQCLRYERRRQCRNCGDRLSGDGVWSGRTEYWKWVDVQLADLVDYCSSPDRRPVPTDAFGQLAKVIHGSTSSEGKRAKQDISRLVRLDRVRRSPRVTLSTLIDVCALKGLSVRDVIVNPSHASSEPLRIAFNEYLPLDLNGTCPDAAPAALTTCVAALIRSKPPHLPHPDVLLRELGISRNQLNEASAEEIGIYHQHFSAQGTVSNLCRLEEAFMEALRIAKVEQRNPFGYIRGGRALRRLAKDIGVTREMAGAMLKSATRVRRAVEISKAKALGLSPEKFRVQRKFGHL